MSSDSVCRWLLPASLALLGGVALATGRASAAAAAPTAPAAPGAAAVPAAQTAPAAADATPIHAVQGRAHRSPLEGRQLTVVGVVTGVGRPGFTLQSPPGTEDDDPATSEALLVVMAGAAALRPGDLVSVRGVITEERPGGRASNLTVTRLQAEDGARLLARDRPLPQPVILGRQGRPPPAAIIDDDSEGSVEAPPLHFDPDSDALDFFESLESMRVTVPRPRAVSPTSEYGEIVVLADDGQDNPSLSDDGLLLLAAGDVNPERLLVDDAWGPLPTVAAGARFAGPLVGVLAYEWGSYRLWLTEPCPPASGGRRPDELPPVPEGALRLVSYNVENLSPASGAERLAALAAQIVGPLGSPDLLALQEIQDGSGPEDDGVVSAAATFAALQQGIDAAGGPTYEPLEIAPVDGADGGQPGGNIRVAFLLRADSALQLVSRPGGTATSGVTVKSDARGVPRLSHSPGRLAPGDAAWHRSRVPLVVELRWGEHTLFVIANHWNSKRGDDALFGPVQPPVRHSEKHRRAQAAVVHGFVAELLAHDEHALVVALGDFNDFGFSAALQRLQQDGVLHDLLADLPAQRRWSYVHRGNAQALDHILVSPGFTRAGLSLDFAPVHLNAAFPNQASDHDPLALTVTKGG